MWSPTPRSDELYHWNPFKRKTKENHKYIARIKEGDYVRYFYTPQEYEAYRQADNRVKSEPKSQPRGIVSNARHFVDYNITGRGYKRDAIKRNKDIETLKQIRKEHPLQIDKNIYKLSKDRHNVNNQYREDVKKSKDVSKEQKRSLDTTNAREKVLTKKKNEVMRGIRNEEKIEARNLANKRSASDMNRSQERSADYMKQVNLDKAEKQYKDKSLFGKVSKIGDSINGFMKERSDRKVVNFLNKNQEYSKQLIKDLHISKKDYDPAKDKGRKGAEKLRKALRERSNKWLKEGETLNEYLDRYGYAKQEKDKDTYYKKRQKTIKHSDIDLYSLVADSDELMHYGRRGMKWYQHIYGPVQAGAQYAKKAGTKLSDLKTAYDERKASKWEKKKEKIIRSGDPEKVRKIERKLSDDDLKRANNRIREHNTLNPQQQSKNFVDKQKEKSAFDLISDYAKVADSISKVYKSTDTIVKTIEDAKKYTPEAREKAAKIDKLIKEGKVKDLLDMQGDVSDSQWQRMSNRQQSIYKAQHPGKKGGGNNNNNNGNNKDDDDDD